MLKDTNSDTVIGGEKGLVLSLVDQTYLDADFNAVDEFNKIRSINSEIKKNMIENFIEDIDQVVISSEKFKDRIVKAIYCLVTNLQELETLRPQFQAALRTNEERFFSSKFILCSKIMAVRLFLLNTKSVSKNLTRRLFINGD